MSETAIRITNLSKSYNITHDRQRATNLGEAVMQRMRNPLKRSDSETFWALKHIDLEIKQGDVVGIIGRNGAGKSTLLKILSRITEPTTGRIELYGRVGSLLEVGTGFHPELTGRENIFLNGAILGMRRPEIRKQFDAIVDFAGVERFLDTPVKRYSSGMYVRLAFAVAAHLNPEILIVDEVLAVGDAEFQKKCIGKMQDVAESGRTVFFVSHNMSAVMSLCQSGVLLVAGRLVLFGNACDVVREYAGSGERNVFRPLGGPLKKVTVQTSELGIEIDAEYEVGFEICRPNLGFVVADLVGNPIFGTNQLMSDETPHVGRVRQKGRIVACVSQPLLNDGDYTLSVWFGDGGEDFCHFPQCVTFGVAGQSTTQQKCSSEVGSVSPRVEWRLVQADMIDSYVARP